MEFLQLSPFALVVVLEPAWVTTAGSHVVVQLVPQDWNLGFHGIPTMVLIHGQHPHHLGPPTCLVAAPGLEVLGGMAGSGGLLEPSGLDPDAAASDVAGMALICWTGTTAFGSYFCCRCLGSGAAGFGFCICLGNGDARCFCCICCGDGAAGYICILVPCSDAKRPRSRAD